MAELYIGEAVCCCFRRKFLQDLALHKRPQDVLRMLWEHSKEVYLVASCSMHDGSKKWRDHLLGMIFTISTG